MRERIRVVCREDNGLHLDGQGSTQAPDPRANRPPSVLVSFGLPELEAQIELLGGYISLAFQETAMVASRVTRDKGKRQ